MALPAQPLPRLSLEEYLALEADASTRHEYLDGYVHAMAVESERHNLVMQNIAFALRPAARARGCRVIVESVKLLVSARNRVYYPDVMVLCDPADDDPLVKRRPCLVAEVLSPSTAATDRREKLEAYQTVHSLETYLIVDPGRAYLEVHRRGPGGWQSAVLEAAGEIEVPCLDASLDLAAVYEGLELAPPDP